MNATEFWNYSLEIYQKPNVAAHCLWLQDHCSCNVNILLLCCWIHSQKKFLSITAIESLTMAIAESEQQLQQHREIRRQAKADLQQYESLKKQELELEKTQQSLLMNSLHSLRVAEFEALEPLQAFALHYALSKENQAQHLQPITEQI